MDKKPFGYYVFAGIIVGALFGSIGAAGGNRRMGIGLGALAGMFLGWFMAAAVPELKKKEK